MIIDTTQLVKDVKGEPVFMTEQEIDKKGKPVTKKVDMILREALTSLLNAENPQNPLTAEKKNKAWQIIKKLWKGNGKKVHLTPNDITFIKERALIFYTPMIYGSISDMIEGIE